MVIIGTTPDIVQLLNLMEIQLPTENQVDFKAILEALRKDIRENPDCYACFGYALKFKLVALL